MAAMQNFLQSTGFYLFSQGENWKCLLMIAIACVLLYLGIRKKFEPLLLVPIAFGMLLTNLPGAEMFHEILFAGGHIHWDLFGGGSVTGELLADLLDQGVSQDILATYAEQLMTAARDTFSPEVMESAIAEIASAANGTLSDFAVELQALVQAEQAAARNGLADRLIFRRGDLRKIRGLLPAGGFDLVVCNPPYYPAGSGRLPETEALRAARSETGCTLEDICTAAAWLLRWGGSFCLVHKPERLADLCCALRARGLEPKRLRLVCRRAGDAPSLLLLEARRGGRPGLDIAAPLCLEDGTGRPTAELDNAYFRTKETNA